MRASSPSIRSRAMTHLRSQLPQKSGRTIEASAYLVKGTGAAGSAFKTMVFSITAEHSLHILTRFLVRDELDKFIRLLVSMFQDPIGHSCRSRVVRRHRVHDVH